MRSLSYFWKWTAQFWDKFIVSSIRVHFWCQILDENQQISAWFFKLYFLSTFPKENQKVTHHSLFHCILKIAKLGAHWRIRSNFGSIYILRHSSINWSGFISSRIVTKVGNCKHGYNDALERAGRADRAWPGCLNLKDKFFESLKIDETCETKSLTFAPRYGPIDYFFSNQFEEGSNTFSSQGRPRLIWQIQVSCHFAIQGS